MVRAGDGAFALLLGTSYPHTTELMFRDRLRKSMVKNKTLSEFTAVEKKKKKKHTLQG